MGVPGAGKGFGASCRRAGANVAPSQSRVLRDGLSLHSEQTALLLSHGAEGVAFVVLGPYAKGPDIVS